MRDEHQTPLSRRGFLRLGAGVGLGLSASAFAGPLGSALAGGAAAAAGGGASAATAKAVILVFLAGGPSHLETFDPKPGRPTGGPTRAIDTSIRGVKIAEHLPRIAEQAHRATIIRSLHSREADHERATYFTHTGYLPQETVTHPSLGAIVSAASAEPGKRPGDANGELALPPFVSVGETFAAAQPGFLGVEHAPLVVPNLDEPSDGFALPYQLRRDGGRRFRERLELLKRMDDRFGERVDPKPVADAGRIRDRTARLLGDRAVEAFDLEREGEAAFEAYGESEIGRGCLLARRLVEAGVRFVEVVVEGWDTHENNFEECAERCRQLDPAIAQLLVDLDERDLLESTTVLCMGEFGRTPNINREDGRDHWSRAFSGLVAGGGFARGRVVGATDENGAKITERPVGIPDLLATLYDRLGLDPDESSISAKGRPIKRLEGGEVVRELLA